MKVNTTKGEMDDSLLEKREGSTDNLDPDGTLHDIAHWTEFWLAGELVHRSVHVELKKWPAGMEAVAAKLFG